MRELTSHKIEGRNEALRIQVLDMPGPGGASHRYHITTTASPPPVGRGMSGEDLERAQQMMQAVTDIRFQKGPVAEAGINGITNEALLAIVKDRLECFQRGDCDCRENAIALGHVIDALHWLHHRTYVRLGRGVEGTSQK